MKIMKVARTDCMHARGWQGYMRKLYVNKLIYRGSAVYFKLNADYPVTFLLQVLFFIPMQNLLTDFRLHTSCTFHRVPWFVIFKLIDLLLVYNLTV